MQEIRLIKSPENTNYLRVCSASFSRSTEGLIPDLWPRTPSGVCGGSAMAGDGGFILAKPDGDQQLLIGNRCQLNKNSSVF